MSAFGFDTLREANAARVLTFKNGKGELAHLPTGPGVTPGDDWSPADWMVAALGELGEAANVMKKLRRGDITLGDIVEDKGTKMTVRNWLAREFADVICYLDLLAMQYGIDLGVAVIEKFNDVSKRGGLPITIEAVLVPRAQLPDYLPLCAVHDSREDGAP